MSQAVAWQYAPEISQHRLVKMFRDEHKLVFDAVDKIARCWMPSFVVGPTLELVETFEEYFKRVNPSLHEMFCRLCQQEQILASGIRGSHG